MQSLQAHDITVYVHTMPASNVVLFDYSHIKSGQTEADIRTLQNRWLCTWKAVNVS